MTEIPSKVMADFIKNLGIGINISRMYPSGHPSLDATLGRIFDLVQEIFNFQDEFHIYVLENIIFIEQEKYDIKTIPAINAMLSSFHRLGVRSVTFKENLSTQDLKGFLSSMGMSREELDDYGDIALVIRDHGIEAIAVNEVEYGIIKGGMEPGKKIDVEDLIKALSTSMTDEASVKFLSEMVGIGEGDNEIAQSRKVFKALEKMSKLIIDRYGEEDWGEYSLLLAKALENLSPSVKSHLAKIKTENEKLAETVRDIITTMSDDDLVEMISRRSSEETSLPNDVVLLLRKLAGPRLSQIMPRLKKNLPEEFYKQLTERLGEAGKQAEKDRRERGLEGKMRSFYAKLRDKDPDQRKTGIRGITDVIIKLLKEGDEQTARMGINRLSATSDAESDDNNFQLILSSLIKISDEAEAGPVYPLINKIIIRHASRVGDEFIERRRRAIAAIGELGDANHISVLFSALWESGLFNETRDAILNFGINAVEPLLDYLGDVEDRGVRMKIIDILKRMDREDLMPILRVLLNDERWYVRRNIVTLLGEFKDHESVEAIGTRLNDEAKQVRLEAVESLARIGGEKVAKLLAQILDGKIDESFFKAATYLPSQMAKKALPRLIPLLKRKKTFPDKKEEELRIKVIKSLANIGDPRTIDELKKVINDNPIFKAGLLTGTKINALEAIFSIGGTEAIKEFSKSRNEEIASYVQKLIQTTK